MNPENRLPQITIDIDADHTSSGLIQAVHRYYPVGFNLTNQQYRGFQDLQNTIRKKVENPQTAEAFFAELKDVFEQYQFRSVPYNFPSPSYSYSIILSDRTEGGIRHSLTLTIKISLLVNFLTVYYEDLIWNPGVQIAKDFPAGTLMFSFKNQQEPDKERNITKVLELVKKHFPSYTFVSHYVLFSLKVQTGTPYDDEYTSIRDVRPVFNYLFENTHLDGLAILP